MQGVGREANEEFSGSASGMNPTGSDRAHREVHKADIFFADSSEFTLLHLGLLWDISYLSGRLS